MFHLPAELIDSIVDNIAKEDTAALKALCLVASVFLIACQRRLLTNLSITSSKRPNTWEAGPRWHSSSDALAHLTRSPHLAAYITHLTVLIDHVDNEEIALAMRDTTVASVFRCLSALQTARIRGSTAIGAKFQVDSKPRIHSGIIQTFLDIYRDFSRQQLTRRLKALSLFDVYGLSVELVRKTLISADSLNYVRAGPVLDSDSKSEHEDDNNDNNDSSHSAPPTSLTISSSLILLDRLCHSEFAHHFSFLRHLTLENMATEDHLKLCFFAAHTLETLRLSFNRPFRWDTLAFPVDFPRLHQVNLYLGMPFVAGEEHVLSSSIAFLSHATALAELTLQFSAYPGLRMISQPLFNSVSFAALDSVLVAHPTLTVFRYAVELDHRYLTPHWQDEAAYIGTLSVNMRQTMPRAAEKGILQVEQVTSGISAPYMLSMSNALVN
ncbi:hypothetical protein MIND_00001000 [Mycena indigotica]|uniref:Uncharacterized protein n=1 Tax=Mycena indigotica TaxID=2126181 RepID=A0A8H6TBY9_9AGAR|nr:uncharacterized protein MIND_00001000 [Mycena indigotica]KAF7314873.1 hypothetical protein MIND_00001000 [Mycena indigotica]